MQPGNIGVRVDLVGDRGVAAEEVGVGKYAYNPFTTDYYEFPVFTQARTLAGEQAISFNSSEGSSFRMPIAVEYNYVAGKIGGDGGLFSQYRQEPEEVFNNVIVKVIADKFNTEGSKYRADEILGDKKTTLLQEVTKAVQAEFAPQGIHISRISYAGEAQVPDSVREAINNVLNAKQKALAAQQETAQAEARAAANRALDSSLTPNLLQYKALEKWDGRLPQATTGATPFINLNQLNQK